MIAKYFWQGVFGTLGMVGFFYMIFDIGFQLAAVCKS